MPEPLVPMGLSQAREKTIERLSNHFANDDLSLEELERRLERAYRATTVAELDALVSDVTARSTSGAVTPMSGASAIAPSRQRPPEYGGYVAERERILAIMGETKRRGMWAVPRHLEVVAVMADSTIDLTEARLPPGLVEIDVTVFWASLRLVVPPGMRVINEVSAIMGSVRSADEQLGLGIPDATVIRVRGSVIMAELKIKTKRR